MNEQQLAEFKRLTSEIIALESAALLMKGSDGDDFCTEASGKRQIELVKILCEGHGAESPWD